MRCPLHVLLLASCLLPTDVGASQLELGALAVDDALPSHGPWPLVLLDDRAGVGAEHAAALGRARQMLRRLLGELREPRPPPSAREVRGEPPVVPALPEASCPSSSYFLDAGSSGVKVGMLRLAGQGKEPPAGAEVNGSDKHVKIAGVGAGTPAPQLRAVLDSLLSHLPPRSPGQQGLAAMLATAGMRLDPEQANATWSAVRTWATENSGFFGSCGNDTENEDCRTIPGSEEARYEMEAMLRAVDAAGGVAPPDAFASAGGASIQVGVRGPASALAACLADLGNLSPHLDPQRAAIKAVGGSADALLVSFLSAPRLPDERRACEEVGIYRKCDHVAGGMNEMRASFDKFLLAGGRSANPCLSPLTKIEASSECSFFGANVTSCAIDRWGGMVSSLPPANPTSVDDGRRDCRAQVQEFVGSDLPLRRWAGSANCTELAASNERWAMLTNFMNTMNETAPSAVDFRDFVAAAASLGFPTAEQVEQGEISTLLSASLLATFLEGLGVSDSAILEEVDADWAYEAARERGMHPGWLKAGYCEAGPAADSPPSHSRQGATLPCLAAWLAWRLFGDVLLGS